MQTRLYVLERRSERSTVAHAYLASGPCPPRCGSRSRFSRTEANPRFRIPYAVAYREALRPSLRPLSFIPLGTYLPTYLLPHGAVEIPRQLALENRDEFDNG